MGDEGEPRPLAGEEGEPRPPALEERGPPPPRPPEDRGEVEVAAYDVKIPPFWPSDPEIWFMQVESQFAVKRVTSQMTRYHHVVATLSPAIASELRDLIRNPPRDRPYDTLKELLIRRTTL